MISFEEAKNIVFSNLVRLEVEKVSLKDSFGRVIFSDIVTDRDMPPFNKSAVDGFACKKEEIGKRLRIVETIAAGKAPTVSIKSDECSRIMTGAKLPEGADYVFMVEESKVIDEQYVEFIPAGKLKENICIKGEDLKQGEIVLKAGTLIKEPQVAILASLGYNEIEVSCVPKVGIICTGDEIVEPGVTPDDVQIRNSNGWQLISQTQKCGASVLYYGIVSDDKSDLLDIITKAKSECDLIILTGGVSMGEFDFVPEVLSECGFKILFDKVAVQPGKPSTFAVSDNSVVFALPGNPVSTLVQFELLVKPFIYRSMGNAFTSKIFRFKTAESYSRKNIERTAFVPFVFDSNNLVHFIKYNGSAHISAIDKADGFACIPAGCREIEKGGETDIVIMFS